MEDLDLERYFFGGLFTKPDEINYLSMEFDFNIDPDHFIEWLKIEEEIGDESYSESVGNMCEYSCLYIAMLLHDKDLEGDMVVYYGKFGFWDHFWIGYTYKSQEYFIDLTLQQFVKDAPKLAISLPSNKRGKGYSFLSDGQPIDEYLKEKRGFEFYTNPHTMIKPDLRHLIPDDFSYKSQLEMLLK